MTTFDEDFPTIVENRRSRKIKKKQNQIAVNKAAEFMSARVYQLMISALEDLMTSKKALLAAFRIWRTAVGMVVTEQESGSKVNSIPDDENSIYAR